MLTRNWTIGTLTAIVSRVVCRLTTVGTNPIRVSSPIRYLAVLGATSSGHRRCRHRPLAAVRLKSPLGSRAILDAHGELEPVIYAI
jgi:hypothetical protein